MHRVPGDSSRRPGLQWRELLEGLQHHGQRLSWTNARAGTVTSVFTTMNTKQTSCLTAGLHAEKWILRVRYLPSSKPAPPSLFIIYPERTNFIILPTRWVMGESCASVAVKLHTQELSFGREHSGNREGNEKRRRPETCRVSEADSVTNCREIWNLGQTRKLPKER